MKKCLLCIGTGMLLGILYKTYENQITCTCKKMMKLEKNMIENGLDIN